MREQRSVWAVYRAGLMGLGLLAGMVLGAGAAQAGEPNRGNSANAHACQHGGWKQLVREGGSSFANQGECVAYAARGGVLTRPDLEEPPLHRAYREACTGDGGLVYDDVYGVPVLGCSFVVVEVGEHHPEATAAMQEICQTAGGAFIFRHEGQAIHVVCTLPT